MTGSTISAIDIVLRMLCDPGDVILVEEFTYSATKEAAKALGLRSTGIRMDEDGLSPSNLDLVLRNWDAAVGRRPRLLYTIPAGHNPASVT